MPRTTHRSKSGKNSTQNAISRGNLPIFNPIRERMGRTLSAGAKKKSKFAIPRTGGPKTEKRKNVYEI